jgi:lysophospholipase L1-like esterase
MNSHKVTKSQSHSNALYLFVFIIILVVSGCAKREIRNINSKGKNIVCFGDSITFGYGVNQGEDYPMALGKMLDIPVINAGVDGDTSTEALSRFKSDVLDRDPLFVIIEFCGNDFLKQIPKETTKSNIKKMVELAQAKGAMVAIVDISAGLFLAEYKAVYRNLSRETDSIFIPSLLGGIITNPSMKSDFLHPNANGYKVVASRIYRAIIPYLNQNTIYKRLDRQ